MIPKISDLVESNNTLTFTLKNTNVSVANSLRRLVLSEINTVVFITEPYEDNKATFIENTSRMNNELLKQRLSCIPIFITDMDFPIADYIVEVDVQNNTDSNKYVTTEDFKIKNVKTDTYLTDAVRNTIFPPDPITGDYIDFVRLRPKMGDNIPGEKIHLTCTFDISNSKHNACFNVVSNCSYGFTQNAIEINKQWSAKKAELKKNKKTPAEIEYIHKDWLILDAQRYTIPDSFDFIIETIGVFDNMVILQKACDIMLTKINTFSNYVQESPNSIISSISTIPNSFDIILVNEDYTLGKVLEYLFYSKYYLGEEILSFCGFQKKHPHDNDSLIRIAFKTETSREAILNLIANVCDDAKTIYEKINKEFSVDNQSRVVSETKSESKVEESVESV